MQLEPFSVRSQRFESGTIHLTDEAWEALQGCCLETLLTMHLTGNWPASTPDLYKNWQNFILDAGSTVDEVAIQSWARLGNGLMVHVTTARNRTTIELMDPDELDRRMELLEGVKRP